MDYFNDKKIVAIPMKHIKLKYNIYNFGEHPK
jgi:hypothetical protein